MKFRYVPELDGLRGVAILAVMGFHLAHDYVPGGALGVDVFFVLSGYLITSLLLAEHDGTGRIDYAAFFGRRARRLLPALIFLLAVYLIAAPFFFPQPLAARRWLDVASAVSYTMNLRQTLFRSYSPLGHTWSLSIEGQFYLLWPFVIAALARMERAKAVNLLISAWLAITTVRTIWWMNYPASEVFYNFTVTHSTGLILGSVLALRPWEIQFGGPAIAGLLSFFVFGEWSHRGHAMLEPMAEVLAALAIAGAPAILKARPLRFMGQISYSVYLWHFVIFSAMNWPRHSLLMCSLAAALSIAIGWISYILIERPFMRRPILAPTLPDALTIPG